MTDSYSSGLLGEQMACDYLLQCGMTVLETRFRARDGEIDIVARDKRRRMRHAGHSYLQKNEWHRSYRFDIIEITRAGVRYVKGNCT